MLPEDLPFRVIRVNNEDEVIARANNLLVGRAAHETASQALSAGHDSISGWCADHCEERTEAGLTGLQSSKKGGGNVLKSSSVAAEIDQAKVGLG